jgi:hypothetical protein
MCVVLCIIKQKEDNKKCGNIVLTDLKKGNPIHVEARPHSVTWNELMKQRTKYGENFIIPSIQDFVIDYVNYAIELKNIKEEYREEKSKHIDFCFMEIPYIPEDSLNGLSGITFKKLKVPWDKKTNTLYDPIAMVHMDELVFEDLNIKVKRDGTIIRMNID